MRLKTAFKENTELFELNKTEIIKANAYLLLRVTMCAFINMAAMSIIGPFLSGFSDSLMLYMVCAVLTGLFCLYCLKWLNRSPKAVLPLFYVLLATLGAYGVALSVFFYPHIPGVTIIGIFVLLPMLVLDRSWRINTVVLCYYAAACILTLLFKPRALAADDCLTLGAFAVFGMLIGKYLRRTRLEAIEQKRQLEIQRDMDTLTGLPNRRVLFETLAELERSAGETSIAAVIMIDIDDFKGYNDRNGHQTGDECLRRLGALFLRFSRESGITVYRYGGEEFLGLLCSAAAMDEGEAARWLVEETSRCEIPCEPISVSAGYAAQSRETPVSAERLISMADSALYEAKRQGRNRAVSYTPNAGEDFPISNSLRRRT